ncbi:MAG: YeeE/YedE family protein [Leptospiraceae bacterium]|nr:YeeE/YedE family protein [Leptospiraceae bacterium]
MEKSKAKPYMNPYIAGFFLGLVLLLTFYVTGRGLGASGAIKSGVIQVVEWVTPSHFAATEFYKEYQTEHPRGPLHSWLVFEIIGVIVGAFISGMISNRLGFSVNKGPGVINRTRFISAAIGGMLFGFGAQLGRGCTSGAALSGMAVMSLGGILTMMAIFGMAYLVAWFGRKLWIGGGE